MNANEPLLLKDEVYLVVGCALEVINGLGHGLHEKPYENALVVEFGLRAIPFSQQPRYPILYKSVNVGEYVPDLIAWSAVVVDAKVIEAITDHERGFTELGSGHEPELFHRIENATMDWLQPIAHIWKCTASDDRHRVVNVRLAHLSHDRLINDVRS